MLLKQPPNWRGAGRNEEDQHALPVIHCGGIYLLSTSMAAGVLRVNIPVLQVRKWRLRMSEHQGGSSTHLGAESSLISFSLLSSPTPGPHPIG